MTVSSRPGPDDRPRDTTVAPAGISGRQLVENLEAAVYTLDPDGRVALYNRAAADLWGREPEAAARWTGAWRLFRDDGTPLEPDCSPLAECLRTGRALPAAELIVERPDGSRRLVRSHPRPLFDGDGTLTGAVDLLLDVTDSREAERALHQSEERFRTLTNHAPVGIFLTALNGDCLFVNANWCEMAGLSPEEAAGRGWVEALHPEDRPRVAEEWYSAVRDGRPFRSEYRFRRRDGRIIWLQGSAVELAQPDGQVAGYIGTVADITQRITFEQTLTRLNSRLARSEEEFRTLADNIAQLAWMADASGWIYWYNRRWYEYTGTTPKDMEGWGWQSVHDPAELPGVMERWKRSIASGEPFDMIFPLRGADGVYRPFLTRIRPSRDADGRVVRWLGTNTDVSDQLAVEQALRLANRDLEQFAFSASHDLQEPLRNVSLYSEMLARRLADRLTPEIQDYLGYVLEGSQRASLLVSDLLTYMRIANQPLEPGTSSDAATILAGVVQDLASAIDESQASVEAETPLPVVPVHEVHLRQVLLNLVGNAIKYRRPDVPPDIRIRAERTGDGWQFSIRDNGIGIDAQYATQIFGLFKRLHPRNERYSGTGIGLALCLKIVERYGGRIWVDSVSGTGATFCFTLPG